jgi:hypothetical protein
MQDEQLFQYTVPAFVRGLENLLAVMKKGEAFAKEKSLPEESLITARLFEDMFTFAEQVQYAYFAPLDFVGALVSTPIPEMPYDEKTFAALTTSVENVVAYLKTLTEKDFAGASEKSIPLYYDSSRTIPAVIHAKVIALPNFYFHCVTAYDILRHKGAPLGKEDFIGALPST